MAERIVNSWHDPAYASGSVAFGPALLAPTGGASTPPNAPSPPTTRTGIWLAYLGATLALLMVLTLLWVGPASATDCTASSPDPSCAAPTVVTLDADTAYVVQYGIGILVMFAAIYVVSRWSE